MAQIINKNTALWDLRFTNTGIRSIDLSQNVNLTHLECSENRMTTLDVSKNILLGFVRADSNELTSIDVSENTRLGSLYLQGNKLTSLDISNNRQLKSMTCLSNPGDGVSKMPVTAWFDNNSVPADFEAYTTSWKYNGKTITIDYRKAE